MKISLNKYDEQLLNKFIALIFVFSVSISSAQDSIVVKGHFIGNSKYAKVLMKKFDVGNFPVGGAIIKQDSFKLVLPPEIPPGVYRFQYAISEGEKYIDIIINGTEKKISFSLEAQDEMALPHFLESDENKKWYEYIKKNNQQLNRINLLNQFINAYPNPNAAIVHAAIKEWEMEKQNYESDLDDFKSITKGSWAYEMVANRPFYFTNPKEDFRIQDFDKREHFWDNFDANNPKLLNTPIYTEHILNYLRYWMNPNMNFSETERTEGFKRSVDVIIRKFSGTTQTQEFAFKYLTLGFKEIGEEEVLQYLDENYKNLAEQCFDEFEKTEFEKRMKGYIAMKPGNKAPNFELNVVSNKNKSLNLHQIKATQTLVVFWSSACPHCIEEMPKLNEWAAQNKEFKIIAVSLDTDNSVYQQTIDKLPNLIHSCDFKAWDTEAAIKFYIAATPTVIALDKNKLILGKYSSISQFIQKYSK